MFFVFSKYLFRNINGGNKMRKSKSIQSKRIISRPLEILLRIIGIWPDGSYNAFCKIFWFFLIAIMTTSQYLYLINHASSINFTMFMYAIAVTAATTVKYIKLIIFWFNERRFNDMWKTMTANWKYNSDDSNTFSKRMSQYLPNIIVVFNAASVSINAFASVVNGINHDEASNTSRPYILMMEYPFDINTKSTYLFVIFGQFLYLVISAATIATINAVLIIFMSYLGDQIDIIRKCLMNTFPDGEMRAIVIKDIIRKHQSVITFSKNIESLYTYIALMTVLFNTIITCGLGFLLVTSIGTPGFSKLMGKSTFYCVITIEIFVYCFAGEYINTKSRQISEAAYNSHWYQSKFHSQIVLFLIMRSQHPLTITMGKFMDLSLERFASITKASASYVTVLLAMY